MYGDMTKAASSLDFRLNISRIGSLLTIFFTTHSVVDYESVSGADKALFARFFNQLLAQGIYWPPSQFEAAFVSLAHSDEDIGYTVTAAKRAISHLQN